MSFRPKKPEKKKWGSKADPTLITARFNITPEEAKKFHDTLRASGMKMNTLVKQMVEYALAHLEGK